MIRLPTRLKHLLIVQFEIALRDVANWILNPTSGQLSGDERAALLDATVPEIQLQLKTAHSRVVPFRELGVSTDSL